MGKKTLKKYNKQTHQWEAVSNPDVTVQVNLPDGTEITDNDVKVTNINYSADTTLNDVLTDINDDISRLERNVSWLDAHKGEGGGGGGGGTGSYKIELISPKPINGNVYINSDSIRVQFSITGPETEDMCSYAYQFDEEPITDYVPVKTNTHVYLPEISIPDGLSYHTLTIKATTPYGVNIVPVSFNIYKSTIKLAFNESEAGDSYKNLTYYIKSNTRVANIPFLITNGMQDAEVTLHAEYRVGSLTKSISFGKLPSGTVSRNFDFWSLIDKSTVEINSQYVLEFYASSVVGTVAAQSNVVSLRVEVINPDQITIILGVNGTSEQGQTIPVDSTVFYNFKISAPIGTSSLYYAAKIDNITQGTSKLILGEYFDDNVCVSGASYNDNPIAAREATISASLYLDESDFSEGNDAKITIKAWNTANPQDTAETEYRFIVNAADNNVYPRQCQARIDGEQARDTILFSWNKNNAIQVGIPRSQWISEIQNYNAISDVILPSVTGIINLQDNNSSSEMKDDDVPYMRIQNHAYAVANVGAYANEISLMTKSKDNKDGFTISLTLNADVSTDDNHTLFLWGVNNPDGTLANGIRIDSDKVYWTILEETAGGNISSVPLSCNFTCGKKKTIDFSFIRTTYTDVITNETGGTVERIVTTWNARIYVNGVMNAASKINEIADSYNFPSLIYFGANFVGNQFNRFADANFYEFSVYTKALNDIQIAVNGKNARLNGRVSETSVIEDYTSWKAKNLIYSDPDDATNPLSAFFQEGKYKTEFTRDEVNNISAQSTIPTLALNFGVDDNFTYDFFYSKHTTDVVDIKRSGTATYYDPVTKILVELKIWASLQGTSTLGYRVKNLEIFMRDTFRRGAVDYPYLFQPKKEWFPESQFTVKADVVDSAHANNAVLGEWINNCGILENNPAMNALTTNTRPKDIDNEGNVREHIGNDGQMINYDEDVSIKHTLEGFPVLVFIKFSDRSAYEFVGIYSFNLGRYSYYNMGMKFLDGFSARDDNGNRMACPRVIKYYEEKETLGNINSSDVFSFEFGNEGNHKVMDHPVWSQYDMSVIQSYGEFKYPTNVNSSDLIWSKLQELFEATSRFSIDSYNGILYNKYDHIKYYTRDSQGNYNTTGEEVDQSFNSEPIIERFSINNGIAYFVIANAFGMTDSLGKNVVLRTWDGGRTWWICFYDMDTGLGISNDGAEDVPVTVSIDKIYMTSDMSSGSVLNVIFHYDESRYAAVFSKLWGILRSHHFIYDSQGAFNTYEMVWNTLRRSGGKLAYTENFVQLMEERVATCGELMYNYDYSQKYIQGSGSSGGEGEVEPAINFLHGTRVDYVRDWLKKHFYYLDGIFPASRVSSSLDFTNTDSAYNKDQLTFAVNYSGSISILSYIVQVSTPTFLGISIGNDEFKEYYIDTPNTNTTIYCPNSTSSNSQIIIKGSTLVTKFEGLQGAFISIMSSNVSGAARSLVSFDISGSNILSNNPFDEKIFLYQDNSSLESLNVSGTHGSNGVLSNYTLNLEKFNRLLSLDCSNSDVASLQLPLTSLNNLNISNSNLEYFTLRNQNSLGTIDFTGCKRLSSIVLDSCANIQSVVLTDMKNLSSVEISNCSSLRSIVIEGCTNIATLRVFKNNALTTLNFSGCSRTDTEISITKCPILTALTLNDIQSVNLVSLDSQSAHNIRYIDLDRFYNFRGFMYDGIEPETYNYYNVVDLSPMEFVHEGSFAYDTNIRYLRVPNYNDGNHSPFLIKSGMFDNAKAITKIFGYIDIAESGVFSECENFFLNYVDSYYDNEHAYNKLWEKNEVGFVTTEQDRYFTNIRISTTSLDTAFKGTFCNIGDVYNIFRNCSNTTYSMNGTFRDCQNIRTSGNESEENYGSIDKNIFRYCTNLTNVDNLFKNCENLKGLIAHEIMDYITPKLSSFIYVFPPQVFFDMRYPLFYENNNIQSIEGFCPKFCDVENLRSPWRVYYMESNMLLENCENLTFVKDSFNGPTAVLFPDEGVCELLKGVTNLKTIDGSFNFDVVAFEGVCDGLLCDRNNLNLYSNKLETIEDSFNFNAPDREAIPVYFGNSFFAACKNTIKSIKSSFGGEVDKWYDDNDSYGLYNDNLKFPYKIFSGCTKLETATDFFYGFNISNYDTRDENRGESPDNLITLPSYIYNNGERIDIFGTCTSLKNISDCFRGMRYGRYQLVSEGFKNNALTNVSRLFSESGNTECHKIGQIPYRLFYQEKNGQINATIKDMSYVFEGTTTSAVSCYRCDLAALTTLEKFAELNPNYDGESGETMYVWNIYLNDGTEDFVAKILSLTNYARLQELYRRIQSGESIEGFEDLLDENDVPLFPQTLPDEWYDYPGAISGEEIRDTDTLNHIDIGYATETTEYHPSIIADYFAINNYICPPDLFRYCSNDRSTSVNGAFYKCSDGITNGESSDGYCNGYYGKLPYHMFKPINNIIELSSIFHSFAMLLPYRWATLNNGVTKTFGTTYNPNVSQYLSNVQYMVETFRNTTIWGRTEVNSLFNSLVNLRIASGLWKNANWLGDGSDASRISNSLFISCPNIYDVSSMFEGSGPYTMYGSLFNSCSDKINNCSAFMKKNINTAYGDLPPFWDYPSIQYKAETYNQVNNYWAETLRDHPDYT